MRMLLTLCMALLLFFGGTPFGFAEQAPEKIRIGIRGNADIFPLLVAEQFGFFDKYGLDVELVDIPSLKAAYVQLLKGDIQFVTTLSTMTITLVAQGERLRAIMKLGSLAPTTLASKSGIDRKTACQSRIVAQQPSNQPRYFVLLDMCTRLGVPIKPENVIVVEAGRYMIPMLEAGKADAALWGAVDGPFAEFMFGLKHTPFSNDPLPTRSALITTETWLAQHPVEARRIVQAIREAAHWVKTSPAAAVAYYGDFMSNVSYQRDVRPAAPRSYAIAKNYWSVTGAFDPRVDVQLWVSYLSRPLPEPFAPLIDPKLVPQLTQLLMQLLDLRGEYLK